MLLTQKIQQAITRASILHHSQKRKGDAAPYITHPFAVAFILAHYTDDEDVVIAGLLHDVLEDVSRSLYDAQTMREEFGDHVYEIVSEVTEDKDPDDSPEKDKQTWLRRKQQYVENLKNDSQQALMVACADKIHNLHCMIDAYRLQGESMWRQFNSPPDKRLWFYEEVLKVVKARLSNDIVIEFEETYNKAKEILDKTD